MHDLADGAFIMHRATHSRLPSYLQLFCGGEKTCIYALVSGRQGDSIGDVKLNSDGDRVGRYSIFQYQKMEDEEVYNYVMVGEFGEYDDIEFEETGVNNGRAAAIGEEDLRLVPGRGQELALDVFRMRWPKVTGPEPPKSVCSEPCPMGHVRSYAVSYFDRK